VHITSHKFKTHADNALLFKFTRKIAKYIEKVVLDNGQVDLIETDRRSMQGFSKSSTYREHWDQYINTLKCKASPNIWNRIKAIITKISGSQIRKTRNLVHKKKE
jgi:hypothetical protein